MCRIPFLFWSNEFLVELESQLEIMKKCKLVQQLARPDDVTAGHVSTFKKKLHFYLVTICSSCSGQC